MSGIAARTRLFLGIALLGLLLPSVWNTRSAAAEATLAVSPELGSASTPHAVVVDGLAAGAQAAVVLLGPDGRETSQQVTADASGVAQTTLLPPGGSWLDGVYRVAVPVDGVRSRSAIFVSSDGGPHLYAEPFLPSVTSSFVISGTGLKPNSEIDMILRLTGLRGDVPFKATTDASGTFQIFIRPEQTGMGFFPAGPYRVDLVDSPLTVLFTVREWPAESLMDVTSPAIAGGTVHVRFHGYQPYTYVWGDTGDEAGLASRNEFVVGPTNISGAVSADLPVPSGPGGKYFLETPYQRGQTVYDVLAPTPTLTPTPTDTPTATPTATATSTPKTTRSKRCHKKGGSKKERAWRKKHCHARW